LILEEPGVFHGRFVEYEDKGKGGKDEVDYQSKNPVALSVFASLMKTIEADIPRNQVQRQQLAIWIISRPARQISPFGRCHTDVL
jgi:hypothetical protein